MAPSPVRRRAGGPALVLGAVLVTALLASGVTYLAVHASDGGHAAAPAAAVASSPSPAAVGGGATTPRGSHAPGAPGAGQTAPRPWLGIRAVTIDPTVKQANGLPVDNGAWIPTATAVLGHGSTGQGASGADPNAQASPGTDPNGKITDPNGQGRAGTRTQPQEAIVPGSPAAQAGLQPGDIITAIDGTALDATHTLDRVIGGHAPGTIITLDVLRNGQTMSIPVTLRTRPANG